MAHQRTNCRVASWTSSQVSRAEMAVRVGTLETTMMRRLPVALPRGFKKEWAMERLDAFLAVTAPTGDRGLYSQVPTGTRDEVFDLSSVIAPVLSVVVPDWRQVCSEDKWYEFGKEREAALRARALLRNESEMAENLGDTDASITTSHVHPWVWEPAKSLWQGGHFRGALQTAGTALDNQLQALSGRSDVQGTSLVQQLLSEKAPEPGKPRLNLPSMANDENDKNLRGGMRGLGEACFSLVRNLTTHNLDEFTEQEALEQMAVLSLFARRVEEYGVTFG